jgi:hypothetical protein
MSQPIIRQIKLRSEEQQTLTKTYNKSTLVVPSDATFSTDLSQSYLNLKLKIKTNNDVPITTEDLLLLKAHDLSISFGNDSLDYSPACMIKSCVLKRGDGSVIESIPFSNVLSQTLFQFTNNKESVANKSLLTGMCFESNALTGSMSSIVKSPIQVQIPLSDLFQSCMSNNWWMSDSKGLILDLEFENSKNLFKLNKIRSHLLKNDNTETPADNILNLKPTMEFNDLLAFEDQFYFSEKDGDNLETNLNEPKCLKLLKEQYFAGIHLGTTTNNEENRKLFFNANNEEITEAEVNSIGLHIDDYVKLNFEYKGEGVNKNFQFYNKIVAFEAYTPAVPAGPPTLTYTNIGGNAGGVVPALWSSAPATYLLNGAVAGDIKTDVVIDPDTGAYSLANTDWNGVLGAGKNTAVYRIPGSILGAGNTNDCVITLTSAIADPPTLTVSGNAVLPLPPSTPAEDDVPAYLLFETTLFSDDPTKYELKYVELLNGNLFSSYTKADNDFITKIHENKLVVSETEITYLKEKGLITHDLRITDTCFDLVFQNEYTETGNVTQMIANKRISTVAPDVIDYNSLFSNGAVLLPNTGKKVKLTKVTEIGMALYELEFTNINIKEDFGFMLRGVSRANTGSLWLPDNFSPPKVKIGFTNFVKVKSVLTNAPLLAKLAEGLTYDIDLLEIVLSQQSKNKKVPMAKVYSSYAVEPFTIENNVFSYEKQFNVTQPNVYNIVLLTPDDNSLVSTATDRNIFSYRYQINNISNTSTDINLKTLITDYPSSLHLDKMVDYFSNSSYQIKTLFGIKGLENVSHVPSILPLKIYTANDPNAFYSNPSGFTVQLAINSNQLEGFLKRGTCYFVKSMIKTM